MKNIIIFLLLFIGIYIMFSSIRVFVPGKLKKAIKLRNETGLNDIQQMLYKASFFLSKKIKLPLERKKEIEKNCRILNMQITPEFYMADVVVTSLFYSLIGLALIIYSVPVSVFASIAIFCVTFAKQNSSIKRKLLEHKADIEKELPQFAGTIRQQLSSTRDIVAILSAYRKVCGTTLQGEITKTINDIKTSSTSQALQNLDRRIGSSKLSELVRGLLGVYNGEDQTLYFELLTDELIKSQMEHIAKQLEQRPSKLTLNFAIMGIAIFLMAISAIAGGMSNTTLFF